MTYFSTTPLLTAKDLSSVWDSVGDEMKGILQITIGSKTITAQQQFEAFWLDVPLVYTEDQREEAEIMFLMILDENRFLIDKIRNQEEIIYQLSNFDNWADSTKLSYENKIQGHTNNMAKSKGDAHVEQTGKNEGNETKNLDTKTDMLTKGGSSDSNTYSEEFNTMIGENEPSDMPLSTLAQNRNLGLVAAKDVNTVINNNTINTATTNNNLQEVTGNSNQLYEYESNTLSSNKAKDFKDYLNLELKTNFRRKLWGRFKSIFITQ